mmetsp:Transcript_5062/g.14904  ORF Transcript_5062/g.14904 Transcript_5062/m.14904 type:complete len:669 (+) Transcript_5062:275-2281(+)
MILRWRCAIWQSLSNVEKNRQPGLTSLSPSSSARLAHVPADELLLCFKRAAVRVVLEGLLERLGLIRLPLVEVHQPHTLEITVAELVEHLGLALLHLPQEEGVVVGKVVLPVHRRDVRVRHVREVRGGDREVGTGPGAAELDIGCLVVPGVQVVRRREDAEELGVVPAEAIRLHLVRADDALQPVLLAEPLRDVGAEHVDALGLPVRRAVANAAAGVAPQHVDDDALVVGGLVAGGRADGLRITLGGDLSVAVDGIDLREARQRRHRNGIGRVVGLPGHPDARVGPREAGVEDQNLLVHEVAERQIAEGLREEVEDGHVVLAAALAGKAVEDVGLKHLVVAAVHVDEAGVLELEGDQNHDDLDGPGAAVDEVAVEEVGVVLGGHPVHRPDVQQVVVLPVHVAADVDGARLGDLYVHEGRARLEQLDHVQDDGVGVLLRDGLLLLLPLHKLLAELRRDRAALVDRASIRVVHDEAVHVHGLADGLRHVARDRHFEFLRRDLLLAELQLIPRVPVLRRQLAELREVAEGILRPPKGQVGGAAPVPPLREVLLRLDGLRGVHEGEAVVLHLDVAEGPVGIVYLDRGVRLRGDAVERVQTAVVVVVLALAQVDGQRVRGQSLRVLVSLEVLVPLILGLLGRRPGGNLRLRHHAPRSPGRPAEAAAATSAAAR